MPRNAKSIIEAYRRGVELLVEARYDWMLTASHVDRGGKDDEYAARCELIARELRRRMEVFRRIEPRWFAQMEAHAHERFLTRDARNAEEMKARGKAP